MSLFACHWCGMPAKKARNSRSRPGKSSARSSASSRGPGSAPWTAPQQTPVQTLANLPIRITQAVVPRTVDRFDLPNRQVSGLEQQRFRRHVVDVERGQQLVAAEEVVESERFHAARHQRVDQERRRAGLEPVGPELTPVEEQQDVERVVDGLGARPAVAVVPVPDPVPVQAGQLRCEDRVQIRLGIAADGGVPRVQGDVLEIVESGEQADLGELADAGQQREPDMCVARLDGPVQATQKVTVRAGDLAHLQRVEDRLVVLVHQHHDPPPGSQVQCLQQILESQGRDVVAGRDPGVLAGGVELRQHGLRQMFRVAEVARRRSRAAPRDGAPSSPSGRGWRVPRTAAGSPRTAPSACRPAGSCRSGEDATESNACLRQQAAPASRSCPRSNSRPPEACGRSGCRSAACAGLPAPAGCWRPVRWSW